jgi:hypothetical protein
MIERNLRSIWLVLILASAFQVFGQPKPIYIYGWIRDLSTHKRVKAYSVQVVDTLEKRVVLNVQAKKNGLYELEIPAEHIYRLYVLADGYIPKSYIFDLMSMPLSVLTEGIGVNLDAALFNPVAGVADSTWDIPEGRASYNASTGFINFDLDYSKRVLEYFKGVSPK